MKTILTVDDSSSLREIASLVLRAGGYEVMDAIDGLDALSKLSDVKTREPNLILTDVNMPGMDGLELARQIRAMPKYRFVPIVVLTGSETCRERKQEAKAAGATAWMEKPFTPTELLAVVKKVMRR
jgi:two-component system, chemotaxis family, chemotaxis protein CheY